MDSYSTDRRYTTRRSNTHRRYTRIRQQGGLWRLLAFQTLVSIILFLIIITAKSIDISAADFIIRQVRHVLNHNVELKSIYAFAQTTVSDIKNSIMPAANDDKGPGLPTAADDLMKKEAVGINGQKNAADRADRKDTAAQADQADRKDAAAKADQADREDQEVQAVYTNQINIDEALSNEIQPAGLSPETSVLAATIGDIEAFTSGQPGTSGMISPIIGPIATPFGEITGPGGSIRMHNGIDISVGYVSDVKAVLDGIVADSGSAPGYGNFIMLSHDNGLTTVYGNCSSIAVKINDPVKKGNVIAMVGEDSMTGGGHLHFEVWNGNDPVDPLEYITVAAG